MNVRETYDLSVAAAATNAVAAAWDECHKIYLLDEESLRTFRHELQYGHEGSQLVEASDEASLEQLSELYEPEGDHFGPFGLEHLVWAWYGKSCGLRFISTEFYGKTENVIPQLSLNEEGKLVAQ